MISPIKKEPYLSLAAAASLMIILAGLVMKYAMQNIAQGDNFIRMGLLVALVGMYIALRKHAKEKPPSGE